MGICIKQVHVIKYTVFSNNFKIMIIKLLQNGIYVYSLLKYSSSKFKPKLNNFNRQLECKRLQILKRNIFFAEPKYRVMTWN